MSQVGFLGSVSPFDSIRQVRADGSEFWLARELMPLMGYARWNEFNTPLTRAMKAAENQGLDVRNLFRASTEKSGGRPRENFELARMAAYLVAMNGDPNKPEVAAAQAYFAVKTREAETRAPDLTSLEGISAILDAGKAALNRALEAEARAEKSEKRLDVIEGSSGFTTREFHKQYFPDTPERVFRDLLYKKRLLIDQRGARGRDRSGKLRNGHQHGHPAAAGKPYFFLEPSYIDTETGTRYYQTKVRPGRPETDLVDQLAKWGLIPNRANLKEITA